MRVLFFMICNDCLLERFVCKSFFWNVLSANVSFESWHHNYCMHCMMDQHAVVIMACAIIGLQIIRLFIIIFVHFSRSLLVAMTNAFRLSHLFYCSFSPMWIQTSSKEIVSSGHSTHSSICQHKLELNSHFQEFWIFFHTFSFFWQTDMSSGSADRYFTWMKKINWILTDYWSFPSNNSDYYLIVLFLAHLSIIQYLWCERNFQCVLYYVRSEIICLFWLNLILVYCTFFWVQF